METFNNRYEKIKEQSRLRVQRHRINRRQWIYNQNRIGVNEITPSNSSDPSTSICNEAVDEVHDVFTHNEPNPSVNITFHNWNVDAAEDIENNSTNLDGDYYTNTQDDDNDDEDDVDDNSDREDSEEEFISSDDEIDFDEIQQLKQWALMDPGIPHARLEQLLNILRQRLLPNLPKCAKTFLHTNEAHYLVETLDDDSEFVYFGMKENLQRIININVHENHDISLVFNVDGLSLFKSSSKQFWPILANVFTINDIYKPFPVAIYCGNEKPANLERYLKLFVDELNELQREGIKIQGQILTVSTKCFVCDRPARAFLKQIKNHGARWACERCSVEGIYFDKRMIYPVDEGLERTDTHFREQLNPEHHSGISLLLKIKPLIDMIKQFILDSMHLTDIGTMSKLLNYWVGGKSKEQEKALKSLNLLLKKLKSQVPADFQRTTRNLEIAKLKAIELSFFANYAGPVIFDEILTTDAFNHFLLFSTACRILKSKNQAVLLASEAKIFLQNFVEIAPDLYGDQCLVGTFHNLKHIADDVINMNCPLTQISAYPFENTLGKIKKKIRNGNKPLQQVCRRLHEAFCINNKRAVVPPIIEIQRQLKVDADRNITIKRLTFKQSIITSKAPNNTVLLLDGTILEIKRIFMPENSTVQSIKLQGMIIQKIGPMLSYPCNSEDLQMWTVTKKGQRHLFNCEIKDIRTKMVVLDISTRNKEKICAMPLLHTF